jgi:GTP-binding protein HflX
MAQQDRPAAVALGVQLPGVSDEEHASSLAELARLGRTLGVQVVARISQRRAHLDKAAVVGRGKLRELAALTGGSGELPVGPRGRRGGKDADAGAADEPDAEEAEADAQGPEPVHAQQAPANPDLPRATIVLVDHEITPSQARNLEIACGAEVLDRTAVILAIFQRHARSREARLQVEIARLSYWAPRVRESSAGKGRQGGGIGGRGAGESQLELDRRKVRDRIAELRTELAAIQRREGVRRSRRAEQSRVALVGYTNAGKSSWMRALTGSEVETADRLFATLDPTVRVLRPETSPRILVSDTVGFIKQLPHELVASFRSTLDEACEASLLLLVVDAADAAFAAQLEVTLEVLAEIGARDVPRLLLLNKIDKVDESRRESLRAAHPEALLVSAKLPADVVRLRERILAFFERDMVDAELRVPYALQRLVSEIHDSCRVLSESYDELGAVLLLRAHPEVLARLRAAVEPS